MANGPGLMNPLHVNASMHASVSCDPSMDPPISHSSPVAGSSSPGAVSSPPSMSTVTSSVSVATSTTASSVNTMVPNFASVVSTLLKTPTTNINCASPPTNPPTVNNARPSVKKKDTFSFPVADFAVLQAKLDMGVSFRTSGNASLNDYLSAISVTITDASRVGNCVEVYFSNSSWALQLVNSGLSFRNQLIEVFPVEVAPKRVTLSNVPPYVPDSLIKALLSKYGKVLGTIFHVPASCDHGVFGALSSYRRSANVVFADPSDFLNLPDEVEVRFGSRTISMVINAPLTCRGCHQTGHSVEKCPRAKPMPTSFPVTNKTGAIRSATISALSRRSLSAGPSLASQASSSQAVDTIVTVVSDTESDVFLVSPRHSRTRKRILSPSCDPSDVSCGDDSSSKGLPSHLSFNRVATRVLNNYSLDPTIDSWSDSLGTISNPLPASTVRSFATSALSSSFAEKVRLTRCLAPDAAAATVLGRQILVLAYSDEVTIKPCGTKRDLKHLRSRYHQLARLVKSIYSQTEESALVADPGTFL